MFLRKQKQAPRRKGLFILGGIMKKKEKWYSSPIKYSYFDEEKQPLKGLGWVTLIALLFILLIYFLVFCCFPVKCHAETVTMTASWYSVQSLKDEGTYKYSKGVMANGQMFSDTKLTCATRRWPLGSILLVRNLRTGKAVRVIVTDKCNRRFKETRVDLSSAAFSQIERLETGLLKVEVIRVK